MRQKDIQYLPIDSVGDFVTNIDTNDLSSNFGLRTRGFRHIKPGTIGERDFGTIRTEAGFPSGISIVDGYPLYVPSEDKEYMIVVGTDTAGNLRIFVDDATFSGNWTELTTMYNALINGTPVDVADTVTIDTTTDILGNTVVFTNNQLATYVVFNVTRNNYLFIASNTATTLTEQAVFGGGYWGPYLGSSGLGWVDNDVLKIYMMTGIMNGYTFNNGLSPHVRWLPQEQLNKVTMMYGSVSGNTITPRRHITIRKSTYSASDSVYGIQAVSGWYIDLTQTTCLYQSDGTAVKPIITNHADFTHVIGEGIKIKIANLTSDVVVGSYFTRYYVTALYRGTTKGSYYEESDPFYQTFIEVYFNFPNSFPKFDLSIGVDLGAIDKRICGFRVYMASKLNSDVLSNLNNWPDNPNDYFLTTQFLFDTGVVGDLNGWTLTSDPTHSYVYQYTKSIAAALQNETYTVTSIVGVFRETWTGIVKLASINSIGGTMLTNIGHTPSNPQAYITPRFGIKLTRDQGSIVAYDRDNLTLQVSAYSGAGNNMDDNLPNVTTDAIGNVQIIILNGRGQLMGLGLVPTGSIASMYSSGEMDLYSVYNQSHSYLAIDCTARRSIIGISLSDSPLGLVWAGKSAIYIMPRDGTGVRAINFNWQNFYDGTLLTSDNQTPYMNDTFRANIIAGYDPTYQEAWFHVQVVAETPNTVAISNVTGSSPLVITTATPHNFNTGDLVYIYGMNAASVTNGTFYVTRINATSFSLTGTTTDTGSYTSGGYVVSTEYLNFRYNFSNNKYSVRKLRMGTAGNTPVQFFSRKRNNTLLIGHSAALLTYPNNNQKYLNYQDDVSITVDGGGNITSVTTSNNGIETLLRVNLARLYSMVPNAVLRELLIDSSGATTDLGDLIGLNLYINGQSTAAEQTAFKVNFKSPAIFVSSDFGVVEKAFLEFTLPLATLTNFMRLELKKVQLGYEIRKRLGNT